MTSRRVDEYGRVITDEQGLVELFYKGLDFDNVTVEATPAMTEYNSWCKTFDAKDKTVELISDITTDVDTYHAMKQGEWLMDSKYQELDVDAWLLSRCATDQQVVRVKEELQLFTEYEMKDVLRLFIYITETLRNNQVWWGVGRGSSVSSYCLFLIGVHRVDSILYDLDIREFIHD